MTKQRPSKLDEHAAQLTEWFDSGMTLQAAQQELAEKRGVRVSLGRLSSWWGAVQAQRRQSMVIDRVVAGANLDGRIEAEFKRNPAPELVTLISLLRVLVQQCIIEGQTDPEMLDRIPNLIKPVLEFVKGQRDEQRLNIEVATFQRETCGLILKHLEDERVRSIASGSGTNDEKIAAMGPVLFGDLWKVEIK